MTIKYKAQTSEQWFEEELVLYAQLFEDIPNYKKLHDYILEENIFNDSSIRGAKRRLLMINRRAEALGKDGLYLLRTGSTDDRAFLVLFSYLETYRLAKEFVFEWLLPKYTSYHFEVISDEFLQFYEHKQLQYPNELQWSDDTVSRLRIQIFRMLYRGKLLEKKTEKKYRLQSLLLSPDVVSFMAKKPPYDFLV